MPVVIPADLTEELRRSNNVVALTGSGISAESGVPTFREAQTGLWERYDPQELATPEAFFRDPDLVWSWYAWRRELVREAEPNPAHAALAELERRVPRFTLVTQNVDGLHRRAGSENVVELHGNILRTLCSSEMLTVEPGERAEGTPVCPNCGAPLRPGVVWFGEALPEDEILAASRAARESDLFLSIGTSGLVYPAAALPYDARNAGATVVEINPDHTPLTDVADFRLRGKAGEVLPDLLSRTFD